MLEFKRRLRDLNKKLAEAAGVILQTPFFWLAWHEIQTPDKKQFLG